MRSYRHTLTLALLLTVGALGLSAAQASTAAPDRRFVAQAITPAAPSPSATQPASADPQLVSPFAGAMPGASVVSGTLAYITQGDTLTLVDFSDIDSPQVQVQAALSPAEAIQVVGSRAYLAGSDGLQIIDFGDASAPRLMGALATAAPARALAVTPTRVYLATDDSLEIVEIADGASPRSAGALALPGPAQAIRVSGRYAFVSHQGGSASDLPQISIIDVGGATPTLRGQFAANAIAIAGDMGYLATNSGLQIIDLAAPDGPQSRGSFSTPGPLSYVQVVGSTAYLAGEGLWVINVSSPDLPQQQGHLSGTFAGLEVQGDLAYVTVVGGEPQRNEIAVVDLADPTLPWWYRRPELSAPQRTGISHTGIISLSAGLAYVLGYSGSQGELSAVDVSDPNHPYARGRYSIGGAAAHQQRLPLIHAAGAPQPGGRRSIFGAQVEGLSEQRGLSEAHGLGLSWLRRGIISWRAVQPDEGGPYNWSALADWEQEILTTQRAGFTPLIIVGKSPRWATTIASDCGPIKPTHYDDFARFMQALVTRYSQPPYNLMYYEIGNEPDVDPKLVTSDSGFGCWGNIADRDFYGGREYGAMLRAVYPAVKDANPRAQVVFGGLLLNAPTGNDSQGYPERFLRGALEAQKNDPASSFDTISYHGYGYFFSPASSPFDALGGFVLGKAAFIRQELARYGRDAPLFNTETAVLCVRLTDDCRQRQADYVPRIFAETLAGGLTGSIWYLMDTDEFYNTGLVDSTTREPRPHYYSYRAAVQQLREARYQGVLGDQESSVVAYQFSRGDHTMLVAWSDKNGTLRAPVPAGTTPICKNRNGATLACAASSDGVLVQNLTRSPLYIIFMRP